MQRRQFITISRLLSIATVALFGVQVLLVMVYDSAGGAPWGAVNRALALLAPLPLLLVPLVVASAIICIRGWRRVDPKSRWLTVLLLALAAVATAYELLVYALEDIIRQS